MSLLIPPTCAALIYVLACGWDGTAPAYIIYVMSAYCLTVTVLRVPEMIRRIRESRAVRRLTGSRFGRRYLDDPVFRAEVSIACGMTADLACAVFRAFVGIRYGSVWFVTMAVYCFALGLMRLYLLFYCHCRSIKEECRCYRYTAWGLILLGIPMGGMIAMTVLTDAGYSYPGYVIYLSAAYTFYTVIHSAVSLAKFRRIGRPVLSGAKALSFVAAMMSVLGLQTAMISRFSDDGDSFRVMMNALTGAAVWTAVLVTAAIMLSREKKMRGDTQ